MVVDAAVGAQRDAALRRREVGDFSDQRKIDARCARPETCNIPADRDLRAAQLELDLRAAVGTAADAIGGDCHMTLSSGRDSRRTFTLAAPRCSARRAAQGHSRRLRQQ